jgi:hypothetical protein
MITREGSGFGYKRSVAAMLGLCNDKPCRYAADATMRRPPILIAQVRYRPAPYNAPAPELSHG